MTIAVLWFWLYLHVKLEKQSTWYLCLAELSSALLCCALNRNWGDAEREIDVCVHVLSRERERCVCMRTLNRNWADAERGRCVCSCWTETEQTDGESERDREMCVLVLNRNWADRRREREREREREVCVCAGKARPRALAAVLVILWV